MRSVCRRVCVCGILGGVEELCKQSHHLTFKQFFSYLPQSPTYPPLSNTGDTQRTTLGHRGVGIFEKLIPQVLASCPQKPLPREMAPNGVPSTGVLYLPAPAQHSQNTTNHRGRCNDLFSWSKVFHNNTNGRFGTISLLFPP